MFVSTQGGRAPGISTGGPLITLGPFRRRERQALSGRESFPAAIP